MNMRLLFLTSLMACDSIREGLRVNTEPNRIESAPLCGDRSKQPDVLFLTVDTLRADHVGYAGYAKANTPNLDALASRGQIFEQAITPVPRTTPALGTLLTGLSPHNHGAREVGEKMTSKETIAAHLQKRGWSTIGVSAIAVAGPDQNLDHGFDGFDVLHDEAADRLTEHTLAQVEKVDQDCPLFLWIHYADPHFPYLPPERWKNQPTASKCRSLGQKAAKGKLARYRLFGNRNGMAEAVLDECTALYDAEIGFTDHAIGELFSGLKKLGRPNPIVAFTADHGENLGEWGLYFEHGPNAHDASLRIPLIMAGPGIPSGTNNRIARTEDIVPTVLSMVASDVPTMNLDGRSLVDHWSQESKSDWVAAESGSPLHARLGGYLVSGRKHRLHCIDGPQFSLCKTPKTEPKLFDRKKDPDLKKDLINLHPREAEMLAKAWKKWPVERTRQRVIRSNQFSLIARPHLDGEYQLALYDHVADPKMLVDVQAEHPEQMMAMTSDLNLWHQELDADLRPIEQRSEAQEDALRALGYIE